MLNAPFVPGIFREYNDLQNIQGWDQYHHSLVDVELFKFNRPLEDLVGRLTERQIRLGEKISAIHDVIDYTEI